MSKDLNVKLTDQQLGQIRRFEQGPVFGQLSLEARDLYSKLEEVERHIFVVTLGDQLSRISDLDWSEPEKAALVRKTIERQVPISLRELLEEQEAAKRGWRTLISEQASERSMEQTSGLHGKA